MRTMIDLGSQRGPGGGLTNINVITTATSVDCAREVRLRRSIRSLAECMVPACCGVRAHHDHLHHDFDDATLDAVSTTTHNNDVVLINTTANQTVVTGTFFGYRKGRMSFCLQDHSRSSSPPLMLLEFAIPTSYLAREMECGQLRIALECDGRREINKETLLYKVPVWKMYCNGRKVGYAIRREISGSGSDDVAAVLKLMHSVSAGAGVLPVHQKDHHYHQEVGEMMYLRAAFERVTGSVDSESFHMINPVGSSSQQLSIFLLRS